jgi:hypothetical protein
MQGELRPFTYLLYLTTNNSGTSQHLIVGVYMILLQIFFETLSTVKIPDYGVCTTFLLSTSLHHHNRVLEIWKYNLHYNDHCLQKLIVPTTQHFVKRGEYSLLYRKKQPEM